MSALIYGLPCWEAKQQSKNKSYLDELFTELIIDNPDPPDSPSVKTEIEQVQQMMKQLTEAPDLLERYQIYDTAFRQYVLRIDFADPKIGVSHQATVDGVFTDVLPLVHKLKLHYQRPRPFQLAGIHEVDINPRASINSHCPSFPSMHSTVANVLAHVCGNKYPETFAYYQNLAKDVMASRVYMGLCLPSDVEAGRRLAEKIVMNGELKVKYAI
jgi:hypothetical protein